MDRASDILVYEKNFLLLVTLEIGYLPLVQTNLVFHSLSLVKD